MSGLLALGAVKGARRFIKKHPAALWIAGGLLVLFVLVAAWRSRVHVESEITSSMSRDQGQSETVLSNADLVVTATGGVTRIRFDANGMPVEITNEGGTLHVQAKVSLSRSTSGELHEASASASSYSGSGPARGWSWGGRAGVEFRGGSTHAAVGLEKQLLGQLGVEGSVSVPVDAHDLKDAARRSRLGLALHVRF